MVIDTAFSEDELPDEYWLRMGAFVKARRIDLGKTQQIIGVEIGLDQAAASRIERGLQRTRLATLFKLAKSLNTSMCDLMAAAEGVSDIDDLRKFLLYKSAPPVYRTMVETALQATERENAQRIGPTSD
jgi:transcriptional regulator with XRE-family HTH domain